MGDGVGVRNRSYLEFHSSPFVALVTMLLNARHRAIFNNAINDSYYVQLALVLTELYRL